MVLSKYVEEESDKHDLYNKIPHSKINAEYTLNEDKLIDKMKANLERGRVHVEKTPKGGALLVYMNPGEFKIVMDKLTMLQVGQKLTVDNINIHVSENCTMEEKTNKNVHHKLVFRLTRRTFPTLTTSPTMHNYPTDQKIMVQGSIQAQSMCEKEFLSPFIQKVLSGKEETAGEINKNVAKINPKKRKKQSLPCN